MNIKDLKASLDYVLAAQVTPFIWGHAGIGKSSIIKQYANEKGYLMFPFYLGTQSDLGDILGLADFIRDEHGTAIATKFAVPEWLHNTIKYCENNPQSGAIIFLDEFNRGRKDILNGMFSLALDKTFHTIKLPANCYVVVAGNPPTDEYFTTDVNETALMSRFVHIKLEPTFDEWVQYAEKKKINSELLGFLREQPVLLQDSRSEFSLPVKVDPRCWERLDSLMQQNIPYYLLDQLTYGIIGLERAVAFNEYKKASDKPLSGEEILNSPINKKLIQWVNSTDLKASLLNNSCDALKKYLIVLNNEKQKLTSQQQHNLMSFLHIVPKDITFTLVKALLHNELFRDFFLNPLYEKPMIELISSAKGIKG